MKKKNLSLIVTGIIIIFSICFIFIANIILTNLTESTNVVCKGQKFSSVNQAMQAMEENERKSNDTSLDYCPPYNVVHTFDYDKNTIVIYSYCYDFDGAQSSSYAIRVLKHNDDGTLSFDSGFADLYLNEPDGNERYYYFTNIKTNKGNKSISFLYLPKNSDKEIYVDGIKAEKILVTTEDEEFYVCYAISSRDTFLTNLFTSVSNRHEIVVKQN